MVRHKQHPTIKAHIMDEGRDHYFGHAASSDTEKFIGNMQGILSKAEWELVEIDDAIQG